MAPQFELNGRWRRQAHPAQRGAILSGAGGDEQVASKRTLGIADFDRNVEKVLRRLPDVKVMSSSG